jgi:hypothetical protein
VTSSDPIEHWHALLRDYAGGDLCSGLADRMRARRLRFGDRVLCPFLRPFFFDAGDEARLRRAAETIWVLGERVARVALDSPELLQQLALSAAELRLARIDPGYTTTSTAARADAFLRPDSLRFAEYNAESPAGPGYSQGLAELFAEQPLMARFRERFDARMYRPIEQLLGALLESYREWGGRAAPPLIAIVDWREVPTFSEFELLRDAFVALGVPTIVCDPRDLELKTHSSSALSVVDGTTRAAAATGVSRTGLYAQGRRIDLVYRRVLINDIVSRIGECAALVGAYEQRVVCVANSLRCKIPHKKAFFAVLTDARHARLFSDDEREVIRQHVPWTAVIGEARVARDGQSIDLVPYLRRHRETFVLKPNDEYGGTGVTLGWETSEAAWDIALSRAIAERERAWVAQEQIAVRREAFPVCEAGRVTLRDMLVDIAPYIFRGRLAGFLTRLSASGLANVTSGGGQVPAFVVGARSSPV